jgi:thiosulfate/3-mercaptopyruvate sulfurtransferase
MVISMPLVSGAELAAHLHEKTLLVCDCRFAGDADASRERYQGDHIPGAVHVYWLDDLSAADTAMTTFLPSEQEAAAALGRIGIADETTVVAYSDSGNLYASRLWHVLTCYGHDRVALLDGGIEKWEAEGRPLERGSVERAPAAFQARHSGWQRGITAQEILDRLEDRELRLVDVRGPAEFSGAERRAARGGHIPGAVLWPWEGNLRADGRVREAAEIRARAFAPPTRRWRCAPPATNACGSTTGRGPSGATTRSYRSRRRPRRRPQLEQPRTEIKPSGDTECPRTP